MMINPLNASCFLELGFLSLVAECLLTDVPVFMELAEKNKKKKIKPNRCCNEQQASGQSSPAGLLSWARHSILRLCPEFGSLLIMHIRMANSRGQGQHPSASVPRLPAQAPHSAVTIITLMEHVLCARQSSKCSRGCLSFNLLNTAQRHTFYM